MALLLISLQSVQLEKVVRASFRRFSLMISTFIQPNRKKSITIRVPKTRGKRENFVKLLLLNYLQYLIFPGCYG